MELSCICGSQQPLAQNNPYSKEEDFGAVYSSTLQLHRLSKGLPFTLKLC